MHPLRPKRPGQTPEQSSPSKHGGRSGGGSGLGAAIAGYPSASSSGGDAQTSDTEGPDSGSGEGTVGSASPVVAKPSFLQNWLNPSLGSQYANYLYNVNPNNQAALQRQQLEGQQKLGAIGAEGTQQRLTGDSQSANVIKQAQNAHVLAMADKYGIPPEKVGDFQNDLYPATKATALSQGQTGANLAANQASISGGADIKNSQRVGMNAEQQEPFFKNLALGGKMEDGPGQRTAGFGDVYNAPLFNSGPSATSNTSAVTTRGPASPGYPNGTPLTGTTTTTGQSFQGGSMSQPPRPVSQEQIDAIKQQYDAQQNTAGQSDDSLFNGDSNSGAGASSPVQTKPTTPSLPGGSLGNTGGIAPLIQWLLSRGGSGGQYNPPTGMGY